MTSTIALSNASKRNKISPSGLFVLLYISRLVVTLTALSSQNLGNLSPDLIISLLLSSGLTIALSVPVILCGRKNKSPFDIRWLGFVYAIYFIFVAAVNVSKFSYFASTTLNPETRAVVFIVIVVACACYCARLGIEAITRFSAFAFFMLLVGLAVAVAFNLQNYREINLYPIITNPTGTILRNTAMITSNSGELIIFLCLRDRVNGGCEKSFIGAIVAAFFSILVLVLFMLAVLGDGASMQSFPLYTLFQVTKFDRFQRLDVFHISFWIMGVFIKTVLLIYCCVQSVKTVKSGTVGMVSSVLIGLLSYGMLRLGFTENIKPALLIIPFCIFCVIVPIFTLLFKKRTPGDELVEKF